MKTKTLCFSIAALAVVPTITRAQLTPSFLSAPDGNPTNALVVVPGGNVGIGTTMPVAKLDVAGRLNIGGGNSLTLAAQDETRVSRILNPSYNLGAIAFEAGFPPTERMRITHGGLVGIGTANPSHLLHVDGGADFSGALILETSGANRGAFVIFKDNSFGKTIIHGIGQETERGSGLMTGTTPRALVIQAGGENPIHFGVNDQVVATMLSGGNVGIGTKSPGVPLHVLGKYGVVMCQFESERETCAIRLNAGGAGGRIWTLESTGGSFGIGDSTANADRLRIDTAGNVGIGTTTPQAKLDVNGKIISTVLELTSDRNQKQDFAAIDAPRILERIVGLPIQTWAYTNEPTVRRIGPMAQDWKAQFPELGSDDKHIATGDMGGVALAGLQALNAKLNESLQSRDAENAALKNELRALKAEQARLASRFEKMEQLLALSAPAGAPSPAPMATCVRATAESSTLDAR